MIFKENVHEVYHMPIRPAILLAALIVAVFASSCVSQPDQFILSETTPREKSAMLTAKGIDMYDTLLLEKNDLSTVPQIRMIFVNALSFDPLNKQAETYLIRIQSFKSERLAAYIKRAKALRDKKTLTDRESYELCLSVRRSLDLDASNTEALKLEKDTIDVLKQVVGKRVASLDVLEKTLFVEKTDAGVEAIIPQTARLINEITQIDSGNSNAAAFRKDIDAFVADRVRKDSDAAKAALAKKDWAGAEAAVLRAERILKGLGRTLTPEIVSLRRQTYLEWAKVLFSQGKYELADVKVSAALVIDSGPVALDLKARIFAARTARDFDSDLADALEAIDSRIASGDLSGAWVLIGAGLSLAKTSASKELLAARKSTVLAKLGGVYERAVAAYNEEAYEDARDGLRTVIAIVPNYQQAAAYLEKINIKLRALEGED
jgi:tetratricopeptide (TPR) repeat protein